MTAVEQFKQEFFSYAEPYNYFSEVEKWVITLEDFEYLIKKFKAMEKEQIIDAFETAEKDCGRDFLHGDLYYHETFKSE